jgi:hypothetical protein
MGEAETTDILDEALSGEPEIIPYRPDTSKYRTHVEPYLKDIAKWKSKGIKDITIRQKLHIDHDTWIRYKKEHSELAEIYAIKNELIVIGLEDSILKKAHGYSFTETIKEAIKDPATGKTSMEVTKEVEKQMAPDFNALETSLIHYSKGTENPWITRNQTVNNVQINNNNFQLPQLEQDLAAIAEKRKTLEALLHTDYEVISEPE